MELILDRHSLAGILQICEIFMKLFRDLDQCSHDLVIIGLVSEGSLHADTFPLLPFARRHSIIGDAQMRFAVGQ